MRLVDYFIDSLLLANQLKSDSSKLTEDWEGLKSEISKSLGKSKMAALRAGYTVEVCNQALFPVIAFIDETILTSTWESRSIWKTHSLQKEFFETSNAGHEFYEKLNQLNRQGDDRSVREIYLLCLSLGFKGKFYKAEDRPKIEEIKVFNLSLLLPKDANNIFEKSTLFNDAYHERDQVNVQRQSRINLMPIFAFTPFVAIGAALLFYSLQVGQSINNIMELVK